MRRRLILCVALLWSTIASAGVSEWIPIEIRDGQVVIPVIIGGQPATALIDTGATGHAISEAFIARHDIDYATGMGAGEDTNIIHNDPVEWFTGTNIKRGKKTDGLLGYDILQHFIVTIDVKRSLLNLDLPR